MTVRRWVAIGCLTVVLGGAAVAEAVYQPKKLRDPLLPLLTPEGTVLDWYPKPPEEQAVALDGIVYDPQGRSMAIIGGDVFWQGDKRGGLEVVKIEPTRVTVVRNGLEQILTLPSSASEGARS